MGQSQGREKTKGDGAKGLREGARNPREQLGGVEGIRRRGREGWAVQEVRGFLAPGTKPFVSGYPVELHSDYQGRKDPGGPPCPGPSTLGPGTAEAQENEVTRWASLLFLGDTGLQTPSPNRHVLPWWAGHGHGSHSEPFPLGPLAACPRH